MSAFASLSSLTWLRALVWLVVLALPLQAQARVSMLACSGGIAHLSANTAPVEAHDHQAMLAQRHHSPSAVDELALPSQAASDPASLEEHSQGHSCSACAVCCLGAALPCEVWQLTLPHEASVLSTGPEPASLNVVAPLLERPPRVLRRV